MADAVRDRRSACGGADVEDLDLANRRAKMRRKGGAAGSIVWQTGTHQLRRSALTHDAEDGTGTPMLMTRPGHTSVRSLARYAPVSAPGALQRHQGGRDPARQR